MEPHPSGPTNLRSSVFGLPPPRVELVYRLAATLGEPLDLGNTDHGHRRIVSLTGGTFTGPTLNGTLVTGAGVGGRRPAGVVYETHLVK
jgi:hypothetical protein